MMHVADGPIAARKHSKRGSDWRNRLHKASKAQENGVAGASGTIKQIIKEMQNGFLAVEQALASTKDFAQACDTGLLALKTGTLPQSTDHPILGHVKACLLFGVRDPALLESLDHVRQRAEEAVEKTERRMDDYSDDLEATAQLALLVTKLPDVGFKTNHPDVKPIRQRYHNLINEVRKRV